MKKIDDFIPVDPDDLSPKQRDLFVNDPKKIIFDDFTNNCIVKLGKNEFYFKDPLNNGFLNYDCNIIIRRNYIILYGNMPVTSGLIIQYDSDDPLGFLKVCAHVDYLSAKIILPQRQLREYIKSELFNKILELLQAFYRALINEKIELDPIEF